MIKLRTIGQKLAFPLLFSAVLYLSLVALLPKKALYNTVQHQLESIPVIIDDERVEERFSGLTVRSGTLYYDGLELGVFSALDLDVWFAHNSLHLTKLFMGKSLKMLEGVVVDEFTAQWSIWSPFHITANGYGNFGSMTIDIDVVAGTGEIVVQAKSLLLQKQFIMRSLRKTKEGYRYAFTF